MLSSWYRHGFPDEGCRPFAVNDLLAVDSQYLNTNSQPGVESGAVLQHRFHETDSAIGLGFDILLVCSFWSEAAFCALELMEQCRV
jgi:hypothetical protein